MLVTLKHLLVTLGLIVIGMVLMTYAVQAADAFGIQGVPRAAIAVLVVPAPLLLLGWPVYTILRLRPLILPICPHCKLRHANYHVPADAWPDGVLLCAHCGRPLRLLMTQRRPATRQTDLVTFSLRWPEFLGIWRRL